MAGEGPSTVVARSGNGGRARRRRADLQCGSLHAEADPATRSGGASGSGEGGGDGDDLSRGCGRRQQRGGGGARHDDTATAAKGARHGQLDRALTAVVQRWRRRRSLRKVRAKWFCSDDRNGFGGRRRRENGFNRSKSVADQPTWTAYMAFVAILLLISNRSKSVADQPTWTLAVCC
ncbi:hypothetical protein Scep_024536 [Stephania cephalantha]|uniref:Uncharacterized protein n=1 Tax=Stephania cephalantha TaxID=152367 RepID=A0AAP0EWQ6_9MAGN